MPYPLPVAAGVVGFPPSQAWTGRDLYVITGANGDSIVLDVLAGATGLDMADATYDTAPRGPGEGFDVTGTGAAPRSIILPIRFKAATSADLRAQRRRLQAALSFLRGPATLTVAHPDGDARQIVVRYGGGLGGDTSRGLASPTRYRYALKLECHDPWAYGLERLATPVDGWSTGAAGGTILPILPWSATASQVLATATIDNPGDVHTFGVWTVTGPTGAVTFTSDPEVGQAFTLIGTTAAGATVVIDTHPGAKTVVDGSTGANLRARLGPVPTLWPVKPGTNVIGLSVASATAATRVQFEAYPRFQALA